MDRFSQLAKRFHTPNPLTGRLGNSLGRARLKQDPALHPVGHGLVDGCMIAVDAFNWF